MPIIKAGSKGFLDFVRNSKAFADLNEKGIPEFVEDNTPREVIDNVGNRLGVLLEAKKTNYLLNSTDPEKHTIYLDSRTYTFSAIGGGYVAITLPSQTLTYQGDPVTFTISGSQIPVTVDPQDSVRAFQLEDGSTHTSIIETDDTGAQERDNESVSHGRDAYFSRNTGTFIGHFNIDQIDNGTIYFHVDAGSLSFEIVGSGNSFVFNSNGEQIQFLNPPVDGKVRFAVTYNATRGYVRCYLNEEVGELTIPFIKPSVVTFSKDPHPTMMMLESYEYRPKALTNGEISKKFNYQFELAYDFVVEPVQVSNWADRIFASSTYGL